MFIVKCKDKFSLNVKYHLPLNSAYLYIHGELTNGFFKAVIS